MGLHCLYSPNHLEHAIIGALAPASSARLAIRLSYGELFFEAYPGIHSGYRWLLRSDSPPILHAQDADFSCSVCGAVSAWANSYLGAIAELRPAIEALGGSLRAVSLDRRQKSAREKNPE